MRSRRAEINAGVNEMGSADRAARSPGHEIVSRDREMNAPGREIDARRQEIDSGGGATVAWHDAIDARLAEIVARCVATNAGYAEKFSLSGASRSAENAGTPKSPAPKTSTGAQLRTQRPNPNTHESKPIQYQDHVPDDDRLPRRQQFRLERNAGVR